MNSGNRTKLYRTALFSGALSIASYVLLFMHQEWVTRHFTRGGVYAVLPIATAFYFSFVHGTFTSCLLHALGFRVAKSASADQGQTGGSAQGDRPPCPPA